MSRILQIRRGTATQNDNFTGLAGELTFDTDAKTVRVHDGETLGGFALARADNIVAPGDTTATNFDINTVPPEFWQNLFATYGPHQPTLLTSLPMQITGAVGLEYIFPTTETPIFVQAFLICQNAFAGYSVGDIVATFGIGNYANPAVYTYRSINGLHTCLFFGGEQFWVINRATGKPINISNNDWRVLFRVYC